MQMKVNCCQEWKGCWCGDQP